MAQSLWWFATTVGNRRKRRADFGTPSAAVFGQEDEEIAHGRKIDGIDNGAAIPARADQASIREDEKLRRHGVWCSLKRPGDLARWQAVRPGLYQQPKDLQPSFLCQGREPLDGAYQFHISDIDEMSLTVKLRASHFGHQELARSPPWCL